MSKMCQNCLHYYDDNLEECPYCNKKNDYDKQDEKVKSDINPKNKNKKLLIISAVLLIFFCVIILFILNNVINKKNANSQIIEVKIGDNELSKNVGEKVTLNPTVLPKDYKPNNIVWESSDTNIAVVNDSGEIIFIKQGVVTITVTVDGIKDSCTITVNEDTNQAQSNTPLGNQFSVSQVKISETSYTISKDELISFNITVTNAAGVINVTSNNSEIISVSSTDTNCNESRCFYDALPGNENTITYTIKGLSPGIAYINILLEDLVSYDEKQINDFGKIGVLVK